MILLQISISHTHNSKFNRYKIKISNISSYSPAIILVRASYSCITLAVLKREVPSVGYTPHAWDPRFLQSILDRHLA